METPPGPGEPGSPPAPDPGGISPGAVIPFPAHRPDGRRQVSKDFAAQIQGVGPAPIGQVAGYVAGWASWPGQANLIIGLAGRSLTPLARSWHGATCGGQVFGDEIWIQQRRGEL